MYIVMKKESEKSIITKQISDKEIVTTNFNKKKEKEIVTRESLFKYCNRKLGYARLLELRDFEYVR